MVDSREGLFEVVGLDAADVVRRGGVQSLHEKMQRAAELDQTQKHESQRRDAITSVLRRAAHLVSHRLPVLLVGRSRRRLG